MAFGDLILAQQLPVNSPVEEGLGLTVYNNQLAVGSFTNVSRQVGFYDINNNLDYLNAINTEETYRSIQYDANENVFWGLASSVPTGQPGVYEQKVFKFLSDGTTILSFDVHDIIPPADRINPSNWEFVQASAMSLTPDGSELWISCLRYFRIYRFSTTGNYLGYFDMPQENEYIAGISTDGTNMWYVTTDGSRILTINKVDVQGNLISSVTKPVLNSVNNIEDIEFDPINFLPLCALWVRGYSVDVGNLNQYAFVYEVGTCEEPPCDEPPVICAQNQCIPVNTVFDPLANVSATDCDGCEIPLTSENVIFNNVDTSTPGMYMVTYEVTSPINGLTSEKSIYVGVVDEGPKYQAITDLIESVALEQTALSHILNAEGEKIQKAVELNLSTEEMMKINDSVADMAKAITALEKVLQGKLRLCCDSLCDLQCEFPD